MRGLELRAVGKKKSIELRYEGGEYVDVRGRKLETLVDWSCYGCMQPYYTFSDDAVPFCPSCGLIDGGRFPRREDLEKHLREQSWAYLDGSGRSAFLVSTHEGWQLKFAPRAYDLERSGRYGQVVQLYPKS
jgi:hypothetical protein